jgi:uncharacterized membrane protein
VERIERSIEVEAPISTVYNQWTQFEEFPRFMAGVQEVRQLDDAHLHWVAKIAGVTKEWNAEIVRQEPDRVIAWRGFGDADQLGTVLFHPIDATHTRVTLDLEIEPKDAATKVADAIGLIEARVDGDLGRLKDFIESRGVETGAWRGSVEQGEPPMREVG